MAMLQRAAQRIEKAFGIVGTPLSAAWDASWLAAAGKNPWAMAGGSRPESLSAVHASVRLLSAGLLGATPRVIRARSDGGRDVITNGNTAALLATTGHDLERVFHDYLLWGNGFALLQDDRLVYVPRSRCKLIRKNGTRQIFLEVTPQFSDVDQTERYAEGEYLHLKMLPSDDELMGQSPLERLAPGLSMAAEVVTTAAAIVRNGANPSGILSIPNGSLKPDARERFRREFKEAFSGSKAGAIAVLDFESDLKRVPSVIDTMLNDSFVQLARFGVAEVARAYGVPLSLLAEVGSVNRSTSEQEARSFAMFSVSPLARSVADALTRLLLTRDDRAAGLSVDYDLRDMLLGAGVERAEYASKLVNGGLASINEVRDLIGLADIEGGDVLARPSNTLPQDKWLMSGEVTPPADAAPVQQLSAKQVEAEKIDEMLAANVIAMQPKVRVNARDRMRAMIKIYDDEKTDELRKRILQ